jgi:hypothetical protein
VIGGWTHLHWRGGVDALQLAFFRRHLQGEDPPANPAPAGLGRALEGGIALETGGGAAGGTPPPSQRQPPRSTGINRWPGPYAAMGAPRSGPTKESSFLGRITRPLTPWRPIGLPGVGYGWSTIPGARCQPGAGTWGPIQAWWSAVIWTIAPMWPVSARRRCLGV